MKILLIHPRHNYFMMCPPLGLGYIASYLIKNNYKDVKIIDLAVEDDVFNLEDYLKNEKFDLIGVSATTPMYEQLEITVNSIKKAVPNTPLIVGGAHATAVGEEIFQLPVDIAILNEGETAFLEVVKSIEGGKSLKNIKGVIYKNEEGICNNGPRELMKNLDELPFPARQLFKLERYSTPGTIIGSRGCPFNCIFCYQKLFGRTWRAHSPDYMVREIEEMRRKYNIKTIRFMDDNPFVSKERMIDFCDKLISSGLSKEISLEFNSGVRVNLIDEELISKLKDAGLKHIFFGVESADNYVLRNIRKGITKTQIENAIKLAKKYQIQVSVFLTVGMPGDTYEKCIESLKFVDKLGVDYVISALATPYPATDLREWVDKNDLWIKKDYKFLSGHAISKISEPVFETKEFSSEERKKALKHFRSYVLKKRIGKFLKKAINPRENYKLVRHLPQKMRILISEVKQLG